MAKITAKELDNLILLIPRLNRKQLYRLDSLIHQETLRKMNVDPVQRQDATLPNGPTLPEETPA